MFEELKQDIRNEISGKTVQVINDPIAKVLREIVDSNYKNRNYEKAIAAQEIYLDDLGGIFSKNSYGVKVQLLAMYDDCGLYHTSEAMNLVNALIKEQQESDMSDSVLGEIDLPAIRIYFSSNDDDYIKMAEILCDSCISVGTRNLGQWQDDSSFQIMTRIATREKIRHLIKEEKYQDADELNYKIGSISRDLLDPISTTLDDTLMAYGLTDMGDQFVDQAIERITQFAEFVPDACYVMGIMVAEGYRCTRDAKTAKNYFIKADELISKLKTSVGYTDYEFSSLSQISQEEIIKQAEAGTYQSKFYIARQQLKNTSTSSASNNSSSNNSSTSSGGCYIATCVYGSYDCPQVWTLRRFRDNTLAINPFGRAFIKTYYAISPTVVKWFGKYNWFHKLFKKPLEIWVKKLNNNGVENSPYND